MLKTCSASAVPMAICVAVALLGAAPAFAQARNDAYRPTDTGPGLGTLDQQAPPPAGGYTSPYAAGNSGAPADQGGYVPRYSEPVRPYGSSQPQAGYTVPPPSGPSNDGYRASQGPSGYDQGAPASRQADSRDGDAQRYDDRRYDDRRYDDRRYDDRQPPNDGTYSSKDIVTAGGSFFGAASEGLAKIVENLFKNQGRPNGYILGEEGGGAFIAGLRYGHGTLYTRDAGSRPIYWEGPTIGYDFGGAGSKTMILVYNLRGLDEIYDRFGGVDGSAYFVGGLGMTLLAHNHVTVAPIRTGVGLRLGANIGYLKFTPRATVNPF
jgi:hypothetical protein